MKDNDLSAIEQIIERYPWYSSAHLELYKRLSELGGEQREAYLHKAAAYLYSRDRLYDIAFNVVPALVVSYTPAETSVETSVEFEEEQEKNQEIEKPDLLELDTKELVPDKSKSTALKDSDFEFIFDIDEDKEVIHRVVISGGDYFSRTDFDTIVLDEEMPLDRFIVEKPSLLRSSLASREGFIPTDEVEIDSAEVFEDSGFYTETLARIYTSQGFYKRALDVYAKLILLYPEKSAYFATLVKELKTKHNT
ncbi:MAG: hypothetical protein ACD_77C00120G0004 [uncultured bacterium]|nr:MAG: hypothetical protein ACD_77C00120G0004 [uncultured bacterium]